MKLALQLGNNDIHVAHEFLSYLSKSPLYPGLDKELTELTRAQHEATLAKTQDAKSILAESKSSERLTVVADVADVVVEKPVNPILEALKTRKTLEPPSGSGGGLPFLAGLMKATADRKAQGQLETTDLEKTHSQENPVKSPIPPIAVSGGLPFLSGLMKATANRRSEGSLESVTSDEKPSASEVTVEKPVVLVAGSAKINPNPPPAPPLPDYLRHGTHEDKSTAPAPPAAPTLPAFLQAIKNRGDASPTVPGAPPLPKPAPVIPEKSQKIKNKLHWGEIRGEEKIKNTIWSELQDDETEKSLDVLKFEELFCVNPSDEARKAAKKSSESITTESTKYIQSEIVPLYSFI